MFDCDIHTHSRFFHLSPEVATAYDPVGVRLSLRAARRCGLDGIAITNHDFFRPETVTDERCLPGIEISTTAGHLLVIGPDPPTRTEPGELDPFEAVALAHEHDCVAIIAHPLRNSSLVEYEAPYDAIEVNGKHPEHRDQIEALANDHDLPIVGGSDAHFPFEVGRVSTRFDIDALTPKAVVEAIRDGRVEPTFRDGRVHQALRPLYTLVHRVKGQL